MAKSYKLKDDNYIDSNNVVYERTPLPNYLRKIPEKNSGIISSWHSNFSTVDMKNYFKYGNVVVIDFRALISTNIPNNSGVIKLPFRPMSGGSIMAGLGGRYDITTPIWLYYSGDSDYVTIGQGGTNASGKYLHIHFCYICA